MTTSGTDMSIDRETRSIVLARTFDAPRALVFQALTDPAGIPRWWGPTNLTTIVDHMDVRPGGTWRFIQRDEEGNEYAFHGEYREVVAPERTVGTFEFEGMPGHVIVETATLEALEDGRTRLTARSQFSSLEALEAMVQTGMEAGARETWERFAVYLSEISPVA